MTMDSIGLGFNSQHCCITGAPTAFVPASAGDNGLNRGKSTNNHSAAIISHNEAISSIGQSANIMHMQQHDQQLHFQSPPMMRLSAHPNTLPQKFPLPPSSALSEISSRSSPPPPPMQPPTPNPNSSSTSQPHPLLSFELPPGMPPDAVLPFLPPPTNAAPLEPIPPPSSAPHALPLPPLAPFIPVRIPSQNIQQDEKQQHQQQNNSVEKALAIAMRFHQKSIIDTSIDCNVNYAEKRQEHFQKERRKLQAFQLKNLEYVMKNEEKELRRHVECMNQMTAYEERQQLQLQLQQQQQRQRQLQLEQKRQQKDQAAVLNDGGGGIGSKEQRRAERTRKRQYLDRTAADSSKNTNNSTSSNKSTIRKSLYVTNLPIDGSTTERTLQSLFRSYGRLDRVTMYRHRSTGELKGDGLIVFGQDAVGEYQMKNGGEGGADLVEVVCTQLNGAEMPCGTVIGVQPADMGYKKKPKHVEEPTHQQQTIVHGNHESVESINGVQSDDRAQLTSMTTADPANETTVSGGSKDKNAKDEDDLDDFFASLE